MILAVTQPYFAPFCGFFQKARRADVLVILDDVQFPLGTTWISRNRFKNDQGTLWLTVPVWKKGLGLQNISQVRICHQGNWRRKFRDSLNTAYRHAPYLHDHLDGLTDRLGAERLIDLNLWIIGHVLSCLAIDTRLVLLSELGLEQRGQGLLLELCRRLGATTFLAQASARKYLEPNAFHEMGVDFSTFNVTTPVYPQLWGDFIGNLSIFDLLFNCGPKAADLFMGRG